MRTAADNWIWRRLFRPKIVAADRLIAEDYTLSIDGVLAPAIEDRCGESKVRCGVIARASVRRWVRARAVTCFLPPEQKNAAVTQRSPDEIVRTKCLLAGEDVATWLVANGWAIPSSGEDGTNASSEDGTRTGREVGSDLPGLSEKARSKGLGLFGLGGWSPEDSCAAEGEGGCGNEVDRRDQVATLPTPQWTYPVATILPPSGLTQREATGTVNDLTGTMKPDVQETFQ